MQPACPICGPRPPAHGGGPCLPAGLVLALAGGLALVAAFFMPWFGTQSIVLTGQFLNRFLSGPGDLSRFIPGSSGGQGEVQLLRGLVLLFPACGLLAAALALLAALRPGLRRPARVVLTLSGLIPLVALILGISRLPVGASYEVGLWLIGVGSLAILLGVGLDTLLSGRVAVTGPSRAAAS
jgi:hypothetical protein